MDSKIPVKQQIRFNQPYGFGNELERLREVLESKRHCGNHAFGQACIELLRSRYGVEHVFLTPSCTAALEMGAILMGLEPGDEVILPSYTFSSTVNAIYLQGAHPVFCEVEPGTMNIDVSRIEALITPKTKGIVPIDYAGIPCDVEEIMEIARRHGLKVLLDAAQSMDSSRNGRPVGTVSDFTAFSFHESKNFSCGEGGALFIKDEVIALRAEMVQEKGTDRSLVLKGFKNKYGWVTKGSSFLLSDIQAAVLLSQLENIETIVGKRAKVTEAYRRLFTPYQDRGVLSTPVIPAGVTLNNHAFFVIFDNNENRDLFLDRLRAKDIHAYIGYSPLHSSEMGQKIGYKPEDLPVTEDLAARIVRLPFYTAMADEGLEYCIEGMDEVLRSIYGS